MVLANVLEETRITAQDTRLGVARRAAAEDLLIVVLGFVVLLQVVVQQQRIPVAQCLGVSV
jgi:hypothetical protein